MKKKYFITYTTQSSVNDVMFHSEIIFDKNPIEWIEQKNNLTSMKYSLIRSEEYPKKLYTRNSKIVSYVSQQGIGDMLFKTEEVIDYHPIIWIINKNTPTSKIKYSLINWWDKNKQN